MKLLMIVPIGLSELRMLIIDAIGSSVSVAFLFLRLSCILIFVVIFGFGRIGMKLGSVFFTCFLALLGCPLDLSTIVDIYEMF